MLFELSEMIELKVSLHPYIIRGSGKLQPLKRQSTSTYKQISLIIIFSKMIHRNYAIQ